MQVSEPQRERRSPLLTSLPRPRCIGKRGCLSCLWATLHPINRAAVYAQLMTHEEPILHTARAGQKGGPYQAGMKLCNNMQEQHVCCIAWLSPNPMTACLLTTMHTGDPCLLDGVSDNTPETPCPGQPELSLL